MCEIVFREPGKLEVCTPGKPCTECQIRYGRENHQGRVLDAETEGVIPNPRSEFGASVADGECFEARDAEVNSLIGTLDPAYN